MPVKEEKKSDRKQQKGDLLAALAALQKMAHGRADAGTSNLTSYRHAQKKKTEKKTRKTRKKKNKTKKEKKTKEKQTKEKEIEDESDEESEEESEEAEESEEVEESEDNEEQQCLETVAAALEWPSITFEESCPSLDQSLVGEVMLYGQRDGMQLLEVVRFFADGQGSKGGEPFNFEVRQLFGTDKGKLSNYLLKKGDSLFLYSCIMLSLHR